MVNFKYEWAKANNFEDFGSITQETLVLVLIECRDFLSIAKLHSHFSSFPANADYSKAFVNKTYLRRSIQGRFCTAQIQRQFLDRLDTCPGVVRWELGLPIAIDASTSRAKAWEVNAQPLTGTVAAIIDDYIEPYHPELLSSDAKTSRVKAFWDQGSDDAWIENNSANTDFGYSKSYAETFPHRAQTKRAYHGVAVAALFCGNTSFWQKLNHFQIGATQVLKDSQDSCIPTLPVVAVQLPQSTVIDTSGAALAANVLDGLRYILDRCAKDAKIVVNISYGTNAGAHDGTSMLEMAIADLIGIDKTPRLIVVFPSGNSREAQSHASFDVQAGKKMSLLWQVPPDSRTPHFMQVWLPKKGANKLSIRLKGPLSVATVKLGETQVILDARTNKIIAMIGFIENPTQSTDANKVLLFVVLAATAITKARVAAPHGHWTLRFDNILGKKKIKGLNAWIERNDWAYGQRSYGKQSRFSDPHYVLNGQRPGLESDPAHGKGYVRRAGTLNSRATTLAVETIGGYRLSERTLAPYSSIGEESFMRSPYVVAPCEESLTLRGLRVSALNPHDTVRMQGTSLAAPLWGRYLLQQFAMGVTPPRSALAVGNLPLPGITPVPANPSPDIGYGYFDPRR